MFGLSTWEILIILVVALIFVGPDQLPKVARQIGKGVRQVRGAVGKVDDEMRRAMREAAAELDDEGKPVVPTPPPPAPLPAEPGRDWNQVGKGAVPGRVATATPARPRPATPAQPGPKTDETVDSGAAPQVTAAPPTATDAPADSPAPAPSDPSPPVT